MEALRNTLRTSHAQAEAIEALSSRVSQDPELSDALYKIVTHVTTIRSTAEILESGADVPPEMRTRFEGIVSDEMTSLADTAQAIVRYFDRPDSDQRPATPIEEVDDYFIANGNYFDSLEVAAGELQELLTGYGMPFDASLLHYLRAEHGIAVETQASSSADLSQFHNQSQFIEDQGRLVFLDSAASSSQRFQTLQQAAALFLERTLACPRNAGSCRLYRRGLSFPIRDVSRGCRGVALQR